MSRMILLVLAGLSCPALADGQPPRLTLEQRHLWTRGGTCFVAYRFRLQGAERVTLRPADLRIHYRATLSNASCPAHVSPVEVEGEASAGEEAVVVVRNAKDERDACRERVKVHARPASDVGLDGGAQWELTPGDLLVVRVEFQHDHFLYGPHDPLLGQRHLTLVWGQLKFRDTVRFSSDLNVATPRVVRLEPSRTRQDPEYYYSPPGALYLAADVPGYQYYRFEDVPVRYGSEWLLRFRYTVARGTRASCRVRVVEYQESPKFWRRLGGGFDAELAPAGEWVLFERRFRVGRETTAIAVDFRMTGSDVGEMWIDEVELVPVVNVAAAP